MARAKSAVLTRPQTDESIDNGDSVDTVATIDTAQHQITKPRSGRDVSRAVVSAMAEKRRRLAAERAAWMSEYRRLVQLLASDAQSEIVESRISELCESLSISETELASDIDCVQQVAAASAAIEAARGCGERAGELRIQRKAVEARFNEEFRALSLAISAEEARQNVATGWWSTLREMSINCDRLFDETPFGTVPELLP